MAENYNFAFEVEGEDPIFIAIEDRPDDPHCTMRLMKEEAREKAAEIFRVPEYKVKYIGCYDDDDADDIGYDTY